MLPCTEMGSSGGALRLSQGYPRPPLSRRGCGWLPGHPTELDAGLRNPVQSSQRLGPRCTLTNIEALPGGCRQPPGGCGQARARYAGLLDSGGGRLGFVAVRDVSVQDIDEFRYDAVAS